jgi:hypothetical protein
VTAVRMTPDLRVARVFVRTLGDDAAAAAALAGLERAAPFIRGCVGRALRLRYAPELRFAYDTIVDSAARMEELLRGPAAGAPRRGGKELGVASCSSTSRGATSAGVIRALAGSCGAKVGHLGTLDRSPTGCSPFASARPRRSRYLLLGQAYTGTISSAWRRTRSTAQVIDAAGGGAAAAAGGAGGTAAGFRGRIERVPPMYSALKRGSCPLQAGAARRGESAGGAGGGDPRAASHAGGADRIDLEVRCSKGRTFASWRATSRRRWADRTPRGPAPRQWDRSGSMPGRSSVRDESGARPVVAVRQALAGLPAFRCRPGGGELRRGQQQPSAAGGAARRRRVVVPAEDGTEVVALVEAQPGGAWRLVRMLQPLQG